MKMKFLLSITLAMMYLTSSAQGKFRITAVEEDTLNAHFKDIVRETNLSVQDYEVSLRLKFHVPMRVSHEIGRFVREREWRKACYNYIYRDSVFRRVKCKQEIDSVYRDSLNLFLIPVRGNNISGENVSLALIYKDTLALDNAQYQYLMEKALSMARQLYQNPKTNVWNEDIEVLEESLSSEQLDRFFMFKYAMSITHTLYSGWKKIVDAGLSGYLDNTADVNKAYRYYLEQKKIKDIYRYRSSAQRKALAELDKHKPDMVRMLETIEKNARMAEQISK